MFSRFPSAFNPNQFAYSDPPLIGLLDPSVFKVQKGKTLTECDRGALKLKS